MGASSAGIRSRLSCVVDDRYTHRWKEVVAGLPHLTSTLTISSVSESEVSERELTPLAVLDDVWTLSIIGNGKIGTNVGSGKMAVARHEASSNSLTVFGW